jgi:hypothetical protein
MPPANCSTQLPTCKPGKQTADPIIFTKHLSDLTSDLNLIHAEKCGVKIGQFTNVEQK